MDFIPLGVGASGDRTTFVLTGLDASPDPSGLRVKKLTFTKPSSTTGVQAVTGVGFRGAALMIWTDRQTAVGVTDGAQMGVGMTDGTTQVSRSIIHPDNEATTTSAQSERTDCIVYLTNATSGAAPTLQARATFSAWTADGFEINWTTNDADTTLFHVLVIGGVDANLVSPKLDVAASGTVVVTGVGFQPEAFITLGGTADEFGTGDYSFGAPFGSIHGFGFANGTDDMCGWTLGRGTGGASDTERGQHTDKAASIRTANLTGAGELTSFTITAIGADGFTMTRGAGGQDATRPVQHVLCLRGARFTMGSFNTPASAGTATFSVTGTPQAVILQTHNASSSEVDGMSLAIGAWDDSETQGGIWIGGTDNANPSVYARASYTAATLRAYTEAATGSSSTLNVDGSVTSVGGGSVVVTFSTVPATPVQVLYLAISQGSRPEGGGTVSDGVNPEAGNLPTDFPLKFVQIKVNGTNYYFGETQLNDNDTWTEAPGKKAGKLANISTVRRELSTRGNYVTSRCSVTLADTDRQFRILASSGALAGSYVALWVVDDATRRAEGAPFRYWAGIVVSHRAEAGFRYTLELEDVLGRRLSEYSKQPQLPPDKFTTEWFPAINPGMEGKAIPIVCGFVSDEDDTTPQGVAPATFAGYFLNVDLGIVQDAYIWSQGAFPENGIWQVFYNDPATPDVRSIVPDSAWGVAVWAPGKPGWGSTGFPAYYADYLGRRYMPLLVLRSHPLAEAAREGRVLIAGNLYGVAEVATGGPVEYIDEPAPLWQWLLVNYVFNRYEDENTYFTIPTLDGTYSIIDTDTVDATAAIHAARITGGYKAGFILGAGGDAETVFDVQQRLLEHLDFDCGINRHGQLIVSAENTAASATATFTAQADIEDGQYEMWTDTEGRINRVEWKYGYRYIPPVAPHATPAEGEPAPVQLPPHSDWRSGLQVTEDTGAQTTVGSIDTYELEMSMVQHAATATDVAAKVLARGLGPQDDGPRMVRFTVPAWRTWVELGDVVNVYHPERVGSSSTGVDKVRILAIEVDPMRDRRTLEGRVIG
jgi:hypothetical protein